VIANPASSQEICAGGNRVIAMVGNHAPRQCRIATFTTDLRDTISAEVPGSDCFVLAMNDPGKRYAYPERVRFEIAESDLTSYRRAADFLNVNGVDVVCLQCATSARGTTLAGEGRQDVLLWQVQGVPDERAEAAHRVTRCTSQYSWRDRGHGMMMSRYREKELERKERRIQRDERENAAGKLVQKIPDLTSLSIAIHETRPEGCVSDNHYIRRVALEHAPALFEVACSDPRCEDGGHDVTREILASLASRQACFEGRHACRGRCGAIDCARVLRYVTTASYREAVGVS